MSTTSKSTAQSVAQPSLFDTQTAELAGVAVGGLDEPPFLADAPLKRSDDPLEPGVDLEDVHLDGASASDRVADADRSGGKVEACAETRGTEEIAGVSPASSEPVIVHPARVVAVAGDSSVRSNGHVSSAAGRLSGPAIDSPARGGTADGGEVVTSGPGSAGTATGAAAPVRRGPLLDAGWLFLIAGIAIIAFTVLVPAVNDLEEARFYRERIQQVEKHRGQRIERYQEYLEAINSADDALIRSLAAVQLNQSPEGTQLLEPTGQVTVKSASPFPALEPPPLVLADRPPTKPKSTLEKWATDDRSRLWLLAGGSLCILIGLLPTVRR